MTEWLVPVIYVGGFVFTYRRTYLAIASSDERGTRIPDAEDRAMSAMVSMLVAMIWPVTIAGYAVWRLATPTTPGQRKAELDDREREIRRLERELGIEKGGR